MAYDLGRSHPNNPFRRPVFYRARDTFTDPAYPMHGSSWLGFGPKQGHVDTFVVHYPGAFLSAQQLSSKAEDVRARLRAGNQSSWKNKGYALYYSFDVPTDGTLWEIRGFNWRNAANADQDTSDGNENAWTFSAHTVLQKVNTDPKSNVTVDPTPEQLETLRWLRWEAREYAIEETKNAAFEIGLIGHGELEPTGCPGDKMQAAIVAGALGIPKREVSQPEPEPVPPLPIGEGMFNAIFKPVDCTAQFGGIADEAGNAMFLVWFDKARADAWQAAGVRVFDKLSLGGFTNCVLLGPLPSGDSKHDWTGAEFFRVVT